MHFLVELNSLTFSGETLRDIDSPAEFMHLVDFEGIDRKTIYYDVFRVGSQIHTIGPPLRNFAHQISSSKLFRFSWLQRTHEIETKRFHHHIYTQKGLLRFHKPELHLKIGMDSIHVNDLQEGPDLSGDNVLVTMNKDNEVLWIKDWIKFHVEINKVSAVVIYDNDSEKYTPLELSEALSDLDVKTVVVSAPFPYGPKPIVMGAKRIFHDKYLQVAMLNHCLHRFARNSNLLINCDIDELIISETEVSELLEQYGSAAIHFNGDWISAKTIRTSGLPSFSDFQMRITNPSKPVRLKWVVNPRGLNPGAFLTTHKVRGTRFIETEKVKIKHFRGMSNNWKENRTEVDVLESTEIDSDLLKIFKG